MVADGFDDAWQEFCLIGIVADGGSEVQFAGMTEEIPEMAFGEKDIEGKVLVNGGRVVRKIPMTDEMITLKVYDVSGDMDGTGVVQHFHPQGTNPTTSSLTKPIADSITDPVNVLNSNLRRKHKVVMLWSSQIPATAFAQTSANASAYRIEIVNAYVTKVVPSFDDKIKSAEVSFKWAPFSKANAPNKRESSTDGSAVLSAASTSVTSLA